MKISPKARKLDPIKENMAIAISVLLDQVDYLSGACRPNEQVGAVLNIYVIEMARKSLAEYRKEKS